MSHKPNPLISAQGIPNVWRRQQRSAPVAEVTQIPAANVLDGLTWRSESHPIDIFAGRRALNLVAHRMSYGRDAVLQA